MTAVVAAAAISKKDFYRHFDDLGNCILATYRLTAENALATGRTACGPTESTEALQAGVLGLLELAAAEPDLAHVLSDPALLDQPQVARARREAVVGFAELLGSGGAPSDPTGQSLRRATHLVRGAERWLLWRLDELGGDASLRGRSAELAQLLELGRSGLAEADART